MTYRIEKDANIWLDIWLIQTMISFPRRIFFSQIAQYDKFCNMLQGVDYNNNVVRVPYTLILENISYNELSQLVDNLNFVKTSGSRKKRNVPKI